MTTAITADAFLNTLGVDTHIGIAGAYSNLSEVEQDLSYLGVPIVRDSVDSTSAISLWQQVAQATGVKFDDFMPEGAPAWDQSALALVPQLKQDGLLAYVEGGNEEDDSYAVSNGNSLAWTAQFQQQVYAMGQQEGIPVINMSFGSGWTAANNWEGDYPNVGNLSAYTDFANAHTYPNVGQTSDSAIQQLNGDALLAAGQRQVITTEMGWQTNQFSATQIAQNMVDATFDGIKDGDAGTWFYGLYDDSSGAWGLFNSDGTPRASATAMHNLTTLLQDNGSTASSFQAGSLDYSLSGTQSGDNSFLMQKSDGSFWIGLWDESAGQHTVTVNLPSAASSIEVYDPITGTSAVQSASNTGSISVSLGSDPLLIEVVPSGSSGSTAASSSSSTSSASTASSAASGSTSAATSSASTSSGGTTSSGGAGSVSDNNAGGASGTPTDLAVSVPNAESVAAGGSVAISGASVSDSWAAGNSGDMALNVWDQSGTLTINGQTFGPGGGPVPFGMFSGTLAQINADLASLSYTASGQAGSDTITVDVWNQAGVEVKSTIPITIGSSQATSAATATDPTSATTTASTTASGSTAQSATTTSDPTTTNSITISPDDASPVETVSNAVITATSGNHMVFISGTGDTATLTGGTESVQAYQGGNTITTGDGNDTIRMAGSGNVVNAGAGSNTIDDSGSNNTIVLPGSGGNDDVYGWVMQNGDTFDLRTALASTSWNGSEGTLAQYISVANQNNNTVVTLHPDGGSAGSVIATLQDTGPVTLAGFLQHAVT